MNFIGGTDFYSDDDTLYGGGDSQFDQYESGYESSQFGGGESIGSLDDHLMYGGTSDEINNLFQTSLLVNDLKTIKDTITQYLKNNVEKFKRPEQYEAFNTFVTNKLYKINDGEVTDKRTDIMKLAVMCYIFTHNVDLNSDRAMTNMENVIEVDFSHKKEQNSIDINEVSESNPPQKWNIHNILMKLNEQLKEKSV